MASATTIVLPPNSGGPALDAVSLTYQGNTVYRENVCVIPSVITVGMTTPVNVTTAASGNTTLVAGSGSTTVRLYRMILSCQAATNIELLNGTSTVAMGPYYLGAYGSVILDDSGEPWMVTSAGNALTLNSSNAVSVTCTVWYTQS